jgi:dTDP-4-amino-4,6-dideoxygalactose transaminase
MKVPFLDLKAQYLSMKDEIHVAIQQVLDATAFAGGPFVSQFEKEFGAFCGCEHAIGVGSGTEALWLCLLAAGIGPGDEVITVPDSFIATAEAISFCGATPAFVDVDDRTYDLDPNKLEAYLKKRNEERATSNEQRGLTSNLGPRPWPKAVIPVHLFGQMSDMDPIMEIARKYGLLVIEDACQAHGAEYKGKKAGSIGAAGCFSFYPGKNLGAYGEAGAVVTNNAEMAAKIRMLRDHGQSKKYYHDLVGWNDRMDGIQGAILSAKLEHLPAWNEARRKNAELYTRLLSGIDGIIVPQEPDFAKHIYHIYAIRVKNRDKLMNALAERGISCGIHYPIPIHLQDAYNSLGLKKGSFPVAEKIAEEFISLPMYPELTEEQIKYVAEEIKNYLSQSPQRTRT